MGSVTNLFTSLALDLRFLLILLRIKLRVWKIQHFRGGLFSVIELWDSCVRDCGDKPYLIGPGYRYTYRECDQMASSFARTIIEKNSFSAGARVAFLGENFPGTVLRILGFMKLGVVPVMLRVSLNESQLALFLRGYHDLRVLYGTRQGIRGLPESIKKSFSEIVEISSSSDGLKGPTTLAPLPKPRVRLEDEAFHLGTSGSDGHSKSASVHHGALLAFAMAHQAMKDLRRTDVIYGLASISHGDGLAIGVVGPWTVGAALYLDPDFKVEDFVDVCVKNDISVLNHIGTLPRKLLRLPPRPAEKDLRIRVSNGHEMLSTVWKEFKERFCVTNIVEYYASTEGTVLFFNKWKFGAVGFIGPISRLLYPFKIVRFDDDGELVMNNGRPVQCGYGEVGEVLGLIDPSDPLQQMNNYIDEGLIKGRILTSVYREGDTWYRTGDLLRRESDGFIYFVGRLKHTVRLDGSYISYQHVEDKILSSQPNGFQIEDCYLTSVKSGDGEKPRLLCYLRIAGGFNERELYKYFAGVLTPHEVPRYIILRQEPFRYTDSHRLLRDIPAVDSATIERLIADSGCLAVDEPLNRHGA